MSMTLPEIKEALSAIGGSTNKRLGQHFLIDPTVLEAVIRETHIHPGMLTLEIGPGLGVLTEALLDAGCEVMAIERDARFIGFLKERFSDRLFEVIRGDAAKLDWMKIILDREWQLVSNLPYAISSLALRRALWSPRPAENVVVMLQREVAERAVGIKKKTSLLSLMVNLASSEVRIIQHVSSCAFYPPPKVDSAILQIESMPWPERKKRWRVDPEKIMELAKKGFLHPRKLLASNLNLPPSMFQRLGLNPKVRAEDLSTDDWAALTRGLY